MYRNWRLNLRLAAAVMSAMAAAGGAVAAVTSYSDYFPATRGFAKETAKDQVAGALNIATARIGNLQRESTETRLQINQLRREGLRSSRWNVVEKMKLESDAGTRRLLQTQLDQIDDDLNDVNNERERLKQ